ncbi:juvenile hormone esterase-like [Zerene cesonia]|uniref:juvenile hormone esterase-like n=1 Tax=Zerene cesonia TaxID=33412 RepID=UPI0018E5A051|nr:juvenile hormone esterase-like [Zerene cesonia]
MVIIQVKQGLLEGEKLKNVTEDGFYYSFKGIPYAAPPLGKLRFKAPQPPLSWEGVRKATEHGPICPQLDIFTGKKLPGNEDCLFLNVYSPDIKPSKLLPVMFYIHGGGLKSGSGNDDHYGPDFLVNQGVVLVTINYRLEALGFLCLDTIDVPGNAGLKDQVAALKWVNENISKFGGDPHNITVFGQSAGGMSTILHVLSPLSKGLFQRAIVMSGSPFCEWALPFENRRRAFVLGKQLGLETEDPEELLEFLQNVPVDKLVDVNPIVLGFEEIYGNYLKHYHFTAVVEKNFGHNAFLPNKPEEILKSGNFNNVDVIFGYTSEECIIGLMDKRVISTYYKYDDLFVPKQILCTSTPNTILKTADAIKKHYLTKNGDKTLQNKEIIRYWSECTFVYPILKLLRLHAETKKCKTYFYRFSSISERNVMGNLGKEFGVTGASHFDDLMYLFNANIMNLPTDKNAESFKMIEQFCRLFTNFAKYGNPTPDTSLGAIWKEYNDSNKPYLDIADRLIPGNNLNDDVFEFWEEIFKSAGSPIYLQS